MSSLIVCYRCKKDTKTESVKLLRFNGKGKRYRLKGTCAKCKKEKSYPISKENRSKLPEKIQKKIDKLEEGKELKYDIEEYLPILLTKTKKKSDESENEEDIQHESDKEKEQEQEQEKPKKKSKSKSNKVDIKIEDKTKIEKYITHLQENGWRVTNKKKLEPTEKLQKYTDFLMGQGFNVSF